MEILVAKVKFYVLTSGDLLALQRHSSAEYSNIPAEDLVVVINTLDKDYEFLASNYCEDNGIEYHITESNGTAARGKNSLIDVFLESDNEYMVQIDGDDYLTPHGVFVYNQVSKMDSPPDAIALSNQVSINIIWDQITGDAIEDPEKYLYNRELYLPTKLCTFFKADYAAMEKTNMYDTFVERIPHDLAIKYAAAHMQFYKMAKKYCHSSESHHRVTWLSRKAVERHKFPEGYKVGEDTLHFYKIKDDYVKGNLDLRLNDEFPATYVYDQRIPSTVFKEVEYGMNWDWMVDFNKLVVDYEERGLLHQRDIPKLKVEYPADYVFNSLETSGNVEYRLKTRYKDCNFDFPANASQKSLEEKFHSLYKFYK